MVSDGRAERGNASTKNGEADGNVRRGTGAPIPSRVSRNLNTGAWTWGKNRGWYLDISEQLSERGKYFSNVKRQKARC